MLIYVTVQNAFERRGIGMAFALSVCRKGIAMRLIDADKLKIDYIEEDETSDDVYVYRYVSETQIDNAPTIEMQRWIPCSERLPELKTECLITFLSWSGYPVIDIDSYDYDGEDGWFSHMDKVIAWMPLPEPYGERSK